MVEEKLLMTVLRGVVKTGKYVLGTKAVSASIKGSKLFIHSSSLKGTPLEKIREAAKSSSTPILSYAGTSFDLGRVCGKPFRVSALLVKSAGGVDLTPLMEQAES